MAEMLAWIEGWPAVLVYLALGAGAAVENVVPAVPADTFVALGGLLSSVGELDARWIFLATWLMNVGSALVTYRLGYRYGKGFFASGWGRRLLHPRQMERMAGFYDRWGAIAIFGTRFLPGLRSVVPVFAGVAHQPFVFVALPLAIASAIWYGALVWIGAEIGRNLDVLAAALGRVNGVLAGVAVLVAVPLAVWWWRTRRSDD